MIGYVEGAMSLLLARLLLGVGEGSAFPTTDARAGELDAAR